MPRSRERGDQSPPCRGRRGRACPRAAGAAPARSRDRSRGQRPWKRRLAVRKVRRNRPTWPRVKSVLRAPAPAPRRDLLGDARSAPARHPRRCGPLASQSASGVGETLLLPAGSGASSAAATGSASLAQKAATSPSPATARLVGDEHHLVRREAGEHVVEQQIVVEREAGVQRDRRNMTQSLPRTLFAKLWDDHLIQAESSATPAVLYVDLHLVHEVTSPQAFAVLRERGLRVRRTDRTLATMDHSTPTTPRGADGRVPDHRSAGARPSSRSSSRTARISASRCSRSAASTRGSST